MESPLILVLCFCCRCCFPSLPCVCVQAFGVNSARSGAKAGRRTADLAHKKQHVPVPNRAPEEPAPYLIAVVGPPGVGTFFDTQCA